ncbi:hypothetical protein ACFLZD_00440 [Candidatus Neomarinimicrobiota bacterium]
MKHLLTILTIIMFVLTGCGKKTTESNDNEIYSYTSKYVVENADYFKFSTNSGSINPNTNYDIMFYHLMFTPPGAPDYIVVVDPRFTVKEGLSIAVLEDIKLEDVTEVPATSSFVQDFVSEEGESYNENSQTHTILPKEKVYIVNTLDGKFPAFQIINYYGLINENEVDIGIFTIDWKYLSE